MKVGGILKFLRNNFRTFPFLSGRTLKMSAKCRMDWNEIISSTSKRNSLGEKTTERKVPLWHLDNLKWALFLNCTLGIFAVITEECVLFKNWRKNIVKRTKVRNLILRLYNKYICILIIWRCTSILLAETKRERETHTTELLASMLWYLDLQNMYVNPFLFFSLCLWMTFHLFCWLRVLWNDFFELHEWKTGAFSQKGAKLEKSAIDGSWMRLLSLISSCFDTTRIT